MKKDISTGLLVMLAFAAYFSLKQNYFAPIYNYLTNLVDLQIWIYMLTYFLVGLPVFALVAWLRPRSFFSSLGLDRGFFMAFAAAFLFTLPMLLGFAVVYSFNTEITAGQIAQGALFAAFFEELYFRAFFFGMLFRFTRIGFVPSLLLSAVVFAGLHIYQSSDPATMIGIFMATLLGAGWFAWLYAEWKNNLWVPIFLHLLMNLYWMLFDAGDNALGPVLSNIFRMTTIAFTIVGTLYYKRRIESPLAVNRRTLWWKGEVVGESAVEK